MRFFIDDDFMLDLAQVAFIGDAYLVLVGGGTIQYSFRDIGKIKKAWRAYIESREKRERETEIIYLQDKVVQVNYQEEMVRGLDKLVNEIKASRSNH